MEQRTSKAFEAREQQFRSRRSSPENEPAILGRVEIEEEVFVLEKQSTSEWISDIAVQEQFIIHYSVPTTEKAVIDLLGHSSGQFIILKKAFVGPKITWFGKVCCRATA